MQPATETGLKRPREEVEHAQRAQPPTIDELSATKRRAEMAVAENRIERIIHDTRAQKRREERDIYQTQRLLDRDNAVKQREIDRVERETKQDARRNTEYDQQKRLRSQFIRSYIGYRKRTDEQLKLISRDMAILAKSALGTAAKSPGLHS